MICSDVEVFDGGLLLNTCALSFPFMTQFTSPFKSLSVSSLQLRCPSGLTFLNVYISQAGLFRFPIRHVIIPLPVKTLFPL